MKRYAAYLGTVTAVLISCAQEQTAVPGVVATPTETNSVTTHTVEKARLVAPVMDTINTELIFEDMQDHYIVVSGEGYDYDSLVARAGEVAQWLQVPFDQQGRVYEPGKGIIVPYDAEDELYRGDYYPRRFESSEVSIEMYDYLALEEEAGDSSRMTVVAGMFATAEKAETVLRKLKPLMPEAKLIRRELFVGCLH